MRAKFVTAGIEDVGLMVTIITRFRRGSFSIGTFEQKVRGETWPKVILQLFVKKKKKWSLLFGIEGGCDGLLLHITCYVAYRPRLLPCENTYWGLVGAVCQR